MEEKNGNCTEDIKGNKQTPPPASLPETPHSVIYLLVTFLHTEAGYAVALRLVTLFNPEVPKRARKEQEVEPEVFPDIQFSVITLTKKWEDSKCTRKYSFIFPMSSLVDVVSTFSKK